MPISNSQSFDFDGMFVSSLLVRRAKARQVSLSAGKGAAGFRRRQKRPQRFLRLITAGVVCQQLRLNLQARFQGQYQIGYYLRGNRRTPHLLCGLPQSLTAGRVKLDQALSDMRLAAGLAPKLHQKTARPPFAKGSRVP